MKKSITPIDFVPLNSLLVFIKKTSDVVYNETGVMIYYPKALYKCHCGEVKELLIWNVKRGKSLSCGCYKREETSKRKTTHGMCHHPLFSIWSNMKNRCGNAKSKDYLYYGARGIIVCVEWRNDFMAFYMWAIANGWQKELELDRIDVNGNYSPDNCRIVTHQVNCVNKRNSLTIRMIELNGIVKSVAQWEKDLDFPKRTIYSRTTKGWTTERILTTPIRKYLP